jgi:alkanesulfonate monooxygenase SsuD/methylene tetrahydromethanopterin reductase-like flavin-dependent oxidoreductase (luciferase family)
MVRFGVSVPTGREGLMVPTGFASKKTIVDIGRHAEDLGYYSVWGNDHITTQNYISHIRPKPSFYEPLISLAAISALTKKIKLATGVLVLPWRTPSLVVFAKQVATLDVLSNGRVILGVGIGAYREESNSLHIKNRAKRLNEGIQGLRELFEKSKATYDGDYVKFTDVELNPKPIQSPLPIFIGQHKPTSPVLDRIARYAQGWVPGMSPKEFKDAQDRLEGFLIQYGRSLSDIELVREISVSIGETRKAAIAKFQGTPAYAHKVSLLKGWGWEVSPLEAVIETSLIGNADEVIKGVQRYIDVNVRHFMLNFAVNKPEELTEAMELFSRDIMPSFSTK